MQMKQAANTDHKLDNLDLVARRIVRENERAHRQYVNRVFNARPRLRHHEVAE